MKTRMLLLLFLPANLYAQVPSQPHHHQKYADQIVAYFVGDEIFQQYVKLDARQSKLSTSRSPSFFQYNFRHPKFSGKTFVIAFTLDSAGQFIPGQETRGLVHIKSPNDSSWITARQALRISRDEGRTKKNSLRLAWEPTDVSYDLFQKTRNFRDIVPGEMVWKIDGEVIFRGDRYDGTFEVNVFTGSVTRRFAIPWD
jgi:hypothetical protein